MNYAQTTVAIKKLVTDGIVPGVNFAFIDGRKVHREIIGNLQVLPKTIPLTNEHLIYDMASLTKVVGTTMVILKLMENKQLNLSDSITKYLPKWQYPKVTIRNLITHTSGIEGYIPHRNELNHDELIHALLKLHVGSGLNHEMHYADVNFIFLGLIAKAITHKPIQILIREMVLTPLEMINSGFYPDPVRCVPTTYSLQHGLLQGHVHDPKAQILGEDCGSAGLFSNMDDLIKFTKSIIFPTTNRVLSTTTVRNFYQDQTQHHLGRSYGFERCYFDSQPYIWQSGYTGTFIVIIPQSQQAFIFLSNRIHPVAPNEEYIKRRAPLIETYLKEALQQK